MKKKKEFTNINVIIVDDSPESVELIKRNLQSKGYQIYTANNVQSAIKLLASVRIDLLITDLKMPGENGIELVRHASENYSGIGILVVTGFPSIQGAVESIKIGAEEYLVKSFTDEELFAAVERVLSKTKSGRGKSDIPPTENFGIIGDSDGMKKVFNTIRKAKSTNATVLIYGESGTGKELAFTGATETRAGFFQTADGGTIFLDEISNTSLAMQAKLLRVLQEKEFYMVGSKKTLKVNVRVVAATNVDLMQLVKKGLFREDLYYRLNIITIDLPPLRERGDDIIQLIYFFLAKYVKELGKTPMEFTTKAMQALVEYAWPGNVRELQNLIHRLVIMSENSTINIPDLPESFRFSRRRTRGLDRKLEDVEREYIQDALAANKNNISQTAISLGIDRKTLRDKLKRYNPS